MNIEPFFVSASGIIGIFILWKLFRAPYKFPDSKAGMMAATGAISKSHKPCDRKFEPSIGKWNGGSV